MKYNCESKNKPYICRQFFLKTRLPRPFNRLKKKSISRKDIGTMGYPHVKKRVNSYLAVYAQNTK